MQTANRSISFAPSIYKLHNIKIIKIWIKTDDPHPWILIVSSAFPPPPAWVTMDKTLIFSFIFRLMWYILNLRYINEKSFTVLFNLFLFGQRRLSLVKRELSTSGVLLNIPSFLLGIGIRVFWTSRIRIH